MKDDTYWYYQTDFGMFMILPNGAGKYGLWFDDSLLGEYQSATSAADDAFRQLTKHNAWIDFSSVEALKNIGSWSKAHGQ